nr:hypothetical protein CFP56_55034 [Quercus suber]
MGWATVHGLDMASAALPSPQSMPSLPAIERYTERRALLAGSSPYCTGRLGEASSDDEDRGQVEESRWPRGEAAPQAPTPQVTVAVLEQPLDRPRRARTLTTTKAPALIGAQMGLISCQARLSIFLAGPARG